MNALKKFQFGNKLIFVDSKGKRINFDQASIKTYGMIVALEDG